MGEALLLIVPLTLGYLLDLWLGDPDNWPHPVRIFGNMIAAMEKWLNKGGHRILKGGLMVILLVVSTLCFFYYLNKITLPYPWLNVLINSILIWYGLANKTLIKEGKAVFNKLKINGLQAGQEQLSRIVGRETSGFSEQQVRIAVLETMSENLSDGVIAPLFYYLIAGVPGVMAYKMINTMDSMVGYRSVRYEQFGKLGARLDDAANLIPARLTAFLMFLVSGNGRAADFAVRFGNKHKSPNAGYPEAALAGILNCRFGGPNVYHGVLVQKPFIGECDREIDHSEIYKVSSINHRVCLVMVVAGCFLIWLIKS